MEQQKLQKNCISELYFYLIWFSILQEYVLGNTVVFQKKKIYFFYIKTGLKFMLILNTNNF